MGCELQDVVSIPRPLASHPWPFCLLECAPAQTPAHLVLAVYTPLYTLAMGTAKRENIHMTREPPITTTNTHLIKYALSCAGVVPAPPATTTTTPSPLPESSAHLHSYGLLRRSR